MCICLTWCVCACVCVCMRVVTIWARCCVAAVLTEIPLDLANIQRTVLPLLWRRVYCYCCCLTLFLRFGSVFCTFLSAYFFINLISFEVFHFTISRELQSGLSPSCERVAVAHRPAYNHTHTHTHTPISTHTYIFT